MADMAISDDPWTWPEETWRAPVEHIRAGRSLKPDSWPGGAKVAVGISFDSDHESIALVRRNHSASQLSQGE